MAHGHILLRCNLSEERLGNYIRHVQSHLHQVRLGNSEMRATASSLFLVKSGDNESMSKRLTFRTDEVVPQSGIYRVRHKKHRLPHEVSLFKDQQFPRCAKCDNAVVFELVRAASTETGLRTRYAAQIRLYELPVLDEEEIAG
jgi:hypothetical protein